MKNLTLVIPTKKESESLPKFLEEIKNLTCRKMVVLQFDDKETLQSIEKFDDLVLYEQKKMDMVAQ